MFNSVTSALTKFFSGNSIAVDNWPKWYIDQEDEEYSSWSWENVDPKWWYDFAETYWWLPYFVFVGYLGSIIYLKWWMAQRPPITHPALFWGMVIHNFAISLYSILLLWRCSPRLVREFSERSDWFYHLACERSNLSRKEVFWVVATCWSKVVHLGDTWFLLLKKKEVPIFHLFHHSTVVFIPMAIVPYGEPIVYLFGMLNTTQHAITYPILLAKTLKLPLFAGTSTFLLIAELVQMVTGLFIGGYTLHVMSSGRPCVRHPVSIAFMNFVFLSMGFLVLGLLLEKICSSNRKYKQR